MRKIIHVDMDAFFASVEQRDNPAWRGKPLIVGGPPNSRGVVAACSYEARRFGVHSAMPSSKAQRLCPDAIFVAPRFDVYTKVSRRIHSVFRQFTTMIEPLGLDEAFLDVSGNKRWQGSATLMANEIRTRIKLATGLTASAGVSYNKFLAKIASDMNKPDGLCVITPEQGEEFIQKLPVRKFFGVGKVTEAKMHRLGFYTGADIKRCSKEKLVEYFGKSGGFYYQIARGIDERPVCSDRVRKSISKEITFTHDTSDKEKMLTELFGLAEKVSKTLIKRKLKTDAIFIKVKYSDFKQVTRSMRLEQAQQTIDRANKEIQTLLERTDAGARPVRLLGVGVNRLIPV